jgi:hypothetical protein
MRLLAIELRDFIWSLDITTIIKIDGDRLEEYEFA